MSYVCMSVMVLSLAAARAEAQSVFGGFGVASVRDDETFLGRGIALSGGLAQPLGPHVAVEGELA
jgi:hypothetical protein